MAKNGYFDKNKDYSLEIKKAMDRGASDRELRELRQERQNKIDSKYGGKDPYRGTSDIMGNRGGGSHSSGGGSSSTGGQSRPASGGKPLEKGPGYVTGGFTTADDGSNWLDDNPFWKGNSLHSRPDMSRRPDLAGQTANSHGMTVFYDENGYAVKAVKGESGYRPHRDPFAKEGQAVEHLWTDQEMMTGEDLRTLQGIKDALKAGGLTAQEANRQANALRQGYGYTIDTQGNVTDLHASGMAAANRHHWGIPGPDMTAGEQHFLDAVYGPGNYGGKPQLPDLPLPELDKPLLPQEPDWGYRPDPAEDALEELFRRRAKAEADRLKELYDAQVGEVQAHDDLLADLYADKRNQTAGTNELERLRMAEMGLANGLNTGTKGQLWLGNSIAYQGALGQLQGQEAQDRAANARKLEELHQAYLSRLEESRARLEGEYYDALNQEYERRRKEQEAMERRAAEAEKRRRDQERWQQEWEADRAEQQWKEALKRAELQASWGDYSGYRELGLIPEGAPDPVPVKKKK